jgi:ABC-type tungstate transport system permease subunit
MSQPSPFPGRRVRPSDLRGRRSALRRLLGVPVLGLLIAAGLLLAPTLASADSASSLTVVGTSDVEDSGLIQNLIEPEFHAAYPQFTFKYDEGSTLEAIEAAENGSDQASAMIVHAASEENQFVAAGYSYQNRYGNAIFTNDFVLAGPASDPAGVAANGTHNIVQAFEDIATAGINGGGSNPPLVTFVSRGGGSGTTVEEHEVWQLVAANNPPAGLLLCAVPAGKGGGETPIAAGGVAASGDPCPGGVLPGTTGGGAVPDWYQVTGLDQGPNVIDANACTGFASPTGTCYVLTDRGTFDYLGSGLDPAGTIPNLTKLTYENSASSPGGANELINYFHAYIINPDATVMGGTTKEPVNLPAAEDFVNFITSPYLQSQLKTYLDDTSDPQGPPFVADASPIITDIGIPTTDKVGTAVTVAGSVTNAEPGYPVLAGKAVTVDEIEAGLPVAVGSATTNASGDYSIRFVPHSSGDYEVSTGQINQIENNVLSPPFGDILSPGATTPVALTLIGLPASHTIGFKKVSIKKGKLTVTGTLKPGPALKGATVKLFALRATGTGAESRIGKVSVGAGKTKFKIKAKLKRGYHWILQLEYVQKGQPSSFSNLKVIDVH